MSESSSPLRYSAIVLSMYLNAKKISIVCVFLALGLLVGSVGSRVLNSLRPSAEPSIQSSDYARYIALSDNALVIFSTSTCPYCRKAREYLTGLNIKYKDYVIDESDEAMALYKEIGGGIGVPVILTAKHKVVGFSQKSLDELLVMDGIFATQR